MENQTSKYQEKLISAENVNKITKAHWQQPQLKKLRVSLDTAVDIGSGPDLMMQTRSP